MSSQSAAALRSSGPAVDRLSAEQLLQLDSICASFAMERMDIPADARELGARYLLSEISFEDLQAGLTTLRDA